MQKPLFFIEFFDFVDILGSRADLGPISSELWSNFGKPSNIKQVTMVSVNPDSKKLKNLMKNNGFEAGLPNGEQ